GVATGIAGCGSPRLGRAAAALAPTATCQPAESPDDVRLMIDHRTAQNLEDFVHNCLESAAQSRVAVGKGLAALPPHRSVRAAFPHTALTSGVWRGSARQDTDARSWAWVSRDR